MIVTAKQILDLMQAKPGKRMSNCFISRKLEIHPNSTMQMLNELVVMGRIKRDDSSRTLLFYFPTDEDRRAEEYVQYVAPFKPYQPKGPMWDRVYERVAEFRAPQSLIRRPS